MEMRILGLSWQMERYHTHKSRSGGGNKNFESVWGDSEEVGTRVVWLGLGCLTIVVRRRHSHRWADVGGRARHARLMSQSFKRGA